MYFWKVEIALSSSLAFSYATAALNRNELNGFLS